MITLTSTNRDCSAISNAITAILVVSCWTAVPSAAQTRAEALEVLRYGQSGYASFVAGREGQAIPIQPAGGVKQVEPLEFLNQYGVHFGITDARAQLVQSRQHTDAIGVRHTRYDQVHKGIRVFGGEIRIHQNAAGAVIAANGDFFPISSKLSTVPGVAAAVAHATALEGLRAHGVQLDRLRVEKSEIVIVDPGWYGDPPAGERLAYHIILTDLGSSIREGFFVDARAGYILDQWSLIHTAQNRAVFDDSQAGECVAGVCSGGPNDSLSCTTSTDCRALVRAEGDAASGDVDIDQAYDYTGDTFDFFFRSFGLDGMDGRGGVMPITVHLADPRCPNAFGGSAGTFFCTGLASDDVVAHEWGHSLTDFTSDLIYQNQTGQLNESYSDIFGELVDLYNGNASLPGPPGGTPWPTHGSGPGSDTPNDMRGNGCGEGLRWIIGEDSALNAIRDMWNPPCFNDPDRANSPLQTCNSNDNGGVHSGSGIPNHAFAMMTDGKSFNGRTVTAIGPIKAAAVWYRALAEYMTPITDFQDAFVAINRAAQDLVGSTPNDPRTGLPSASAITSFDADQVREALLAVEMDTPGACGSGPPPHFVELAQHCADRTVVFADDFESGAPGWSVSNTGPPTPYDWVLTSTPLPQGRLGIAYFGEDRDIGDCSVQDESAVHSLTSPPIVLPSDGDFPMLSFTHFVRTEGVWDGGNLSVQSNGGGWQFVPRSAFLHNAYNARINTVSQGNSNPLAGQAGWSRTGGQWITTVVDLSGFAGADDTLEIRFDLGKDGCTGLTGWFVDDLEVYTCPDCDANGTADHREVHVHHTSPPLAGIGTGAPQSFLVTAPPPAATDVTIVLTAVGHFRTDDRFVNVALNGTPIGTVFSRQSTNCSPTPHVNQITVDAATFNALVAGGNAVIDMTTPNTVDPALCDGDSFISLALSYRALGVEVPADPIEKNRYLSMDVGGLLGQQMAIRVTLQNLPPPFDCYSGEERWVGIPREVSERSGLNDATPPTFQIAELVNFPVVIDAGLVSGRLHVYGVEVLPNAEYEIQALEAPCGTIVSDSNAPIISIGTTELWGDVAGAFEDGEWTPPNSAVGITDCLSILNKFADLPTAPIKARADLQPDAPDQIVNIADVFFCLEGFRSFAYSFAGPQPPCP